MLAAQARRGCTLCTPGLDGPHGCAAQAAAGAYAVGLHTQQGEHVAVPRLLLSQECLHGLAGRWLCALQAVDSAGAVACGWACDPILHVYY